MMILDRHSDMFDSSIIDPEWDDEPIDLEKIAQSRAYCYPIHEDPTGAERVSLRREINRTLLTLKAREERVLRLRFGLGELRREYTLGEIGASFGVGRERIRQIEKIALRKLKHPSRSRRLIHLWSDWTPPPPPPPPPSEPLPLPPPKRRLDRLVERKMTEASLQAYTQMVTDLNQMWRGDDVPTETDL
jgi:hypothetical protein